MLYFTSDLHFGHKNILKFGRGNTYNTIEEHDQGIIDNWNKVVKKGDEVYVLGDASLSTNVNFLKEKLEKLNGNKHLIKGNHDRLKIHAELCNLNIWASIHEYLEKNVVLNDKEYRLILSHYPILEFNGAFKPNVIHLYGHIHDMNDYDDIYKKLGFKALHVGLDCSNKYKNTDKYTPISLENLIEYLK